MSERRIVVRPEGVTISAGDGSSRFVPAPPGYSLSYMDADGRIVGQGERAVDGWYDWHFVLEGETLRRDGPAY